MNTIEVKVQKSAGVQLAEKMLESQRQTVKEAKEEYQNPDSQIRKAVEELKKRNAERGTPVVRL